MKSQNVSIHDSSIKDIKDSIKRYGGFKKLSQKLCVSPQILYYWIKSGIIPPKRCLQIEKITLGEVKASKIRPDIFNSKSCDSSNKKIIENIKKCQKILNGLIEEIIVPSEGK